MKRYTPTALDLAWARNVVAITTNGAIWIWKATLLTYRFDHEEKQLILLNPQLLKDKELREAHEMTIEVFKKIGYTVKSSHIN
jgi:hypothetical protein